MCRYVHHSSVLLLLGQDDYDDSSLKMKRKYPLCFLHHISHETNQCVCVRGCVAVGRNSHVSFFLFFFIDCGN